MDLAGILLGFMMESCICGLNAIIISLPYFRK
jgi:hypothetical protein